MTQTYSILIAGTLAIILALHSIATMSRRSVWPTILLGLIGSGCVIGGTMMFVVHMVAP